MDTSIIGLIVIAAVGVALLVAAIGWMVLTKPREDSPDLDPIVEDAGREALSVREQEAQADQIFADGRRAARADADSAHAVRLGQQLHGYRTEAPTSRPDHDRHRDVADVMADHPDPRHDER